MHYKLKLITIVSFAITLSACSHSQSKLSFTPLTMLFRTDTLGEDNTQSITRFEEYLVANYIDSKEAEKQIDSFAFRHVSDDVKTFTSYHIIFYKKTSRTTVEIIIDYKNRIPPESLDDKIYDYWWEKGKFLVRYKLRNRRIVEPEKEIKVSEVPKTASKINF